MTAARRWLLVALVLLAGGRAASAHVTSTGLAAVTVSGSLVTYRLTVVPGDLPEPAAALVTAAAGGDRASVDRIAEALRTRISFAAGEAPCPPGRGAIQGSRVGDGRVILEMTFHCPAAPVALRIRDDWSSLFGAHYRTLARIEGPGGVREVALLPESPEATVSLATAAAPHPSFFWLGVNHILRGYDHLLFLVALLLRGGTVAMLLQIITAFTVAHSITLALAVVGAVTLPNRAVEAAIAASIVWVAAENVLRRTTPPRRWLVSFLFGLVHGLGFAAALAPLALPGRNLVLALLGFNVGVEAGQAVVVALAMPLLARLRHRPWERQLVRFASVALGLVGVAWLVERLLLT